jgi:hypothetical protein
MTVSKPKLRWFQFSLRTLLVFVTLCAVLCSWVAVKIDRARREWKVFAEIRDLGVWYRMSNSPGPAWLRNTLGFDLFQHVEYLAFGDVKVTETRLERLKELSQLRDLDIRDQPVTDVELLQLKGLSQLRWLNLSGTKVTDAGLEHLGELKQLQELFLSGCPITRKGVRKLQKSLPNCRIDEGFWTNRATGATPAASSKGENQSA